MDESVVSAQLLAFNEIAVFKRFAMRVLVVVTPAQGCHFLNPEVIGKRADLINHLFDCVLDFEA